VHASLLSHRLATLDLTAVDAAELSSIVAEEALQVLGGRRAVVWFNRPALGALVLEQRDRDVRSLSLDDSMAEIVLEHSEPAWRLPAEPGPGQPDARMALAEGSFGPAVGEEAAGVVGLPLRAGRGAVGVLLVDGLLDVPDGAGDFIAQAASVVVNHDVLTASRRHELQLEALYRTAGELSSKLELPAVLEAIVERSRVLADSAISYIMLVDREHSEIYMRVASGVTHPSFNNLRLGIGSGLGGRAAERRQAFYTSDYLNDGRFTHLGPVDAEVRKEGIKSILGTPLHASGEFVGVLFVADRMVRVFTDAEVEIVASLARHAALAIENASLYERTSRALETVQEANRTVEESNRRLRRLDEAHQRLSEALLNQQGLAGIVAVMTDLAGGAHVAVLDERHRILASAGRAADPFGDSLARAGLRPDAARERGVQGVVAAAERYVSAVLPRRENERTVDRLVVPVVARAELLGTVWAAIDPERLADDRPLIEQAARVVALELLKERSVMDTERRLRRELLDELLAERALADEGLPRHRTDRR
jgi:GAF domain-containing protein